MSSTNGIDTILWDAFFSKGKAEKPCDMCGEPGMEMQASPNYNTCEEHAHIPPVFRMDVRELHEDTV